MMKKSYIDITEVLKKNRIITISIIAGAVLISTVSVFLTFAMHKKSLNSAFAINTDGAVIPLKLVEQKENIQVEALAHLDLFHTYFYGISPTNYEKNLEKALWLGNNSVTESYKQKKSLGIYNKLIQFSLVQEVESVTTRLDLRKEPYGFESVVKFKVIRGSVVDKYEQITTGNLISVSRNFPHNTHGLLITNYFEKPLKKIKDES